MFKALIELPLCPRRPWVLPADDPLATLKFKEHLTILANIPGLRIEDYLLEACSNGCPTMSHL
ncbi:hypothetical protein CFP56_039504 [Quercus suber]|uniref:Uncharacterized protein n=1 Tax=Quercus suber TaxID=58331 RepID=A0AAW0IYY8_QUESU